MPSLSCSLSLSRHLLLLSLLAAAAAADEARTMQALRDELAPPEWDPAEPDFCSWRGVSCSTAGAGAAVVAALELPRQGLKGNLSLVSELKSLTRLDLSFNSFHGGIPPAIGGMAGLEFLDLSMNKLSGPIPESLGGATRLKFLNLSNNLLSGAIPDELKNLLRLQEVQLSGNSLTGGIPDWFADLPSLRILSAYENSLSGPIPANLGLRSQLQVLNLHSNTLDGAIPATICSSGQLQVLILTVNRLTGGIPESIGRCRGLSNVRIGNNRLAGRIPASVGDVSGLTYFEADDNDLSGGIPPQFALCTNLTLLNLAYNKLVGTVPGVLGELRNLQELIVSGNGLTGDFPTAILRCRNLSKLDLSYNKFGGNLPDIICNNSRLQFLVLDHNVFAGAIPRGIGGCVRLLELQLGSNDLTGAIPPEIGRIKNLQIALNLSYNRLAGTLPRELGKLDKLVSLDLSSNEIAGEIPVELRGMLSLIEVNLSNNRLSGAIPAFGPFQKSTWSSFSGNAELCGDPLDSKCGDAAYGASDDDVHRRVNSSRVALAAAGSCVIIFAAVSVVVALFMWRERQEKEAEAAKKAAGAVTEAPRPVIVAANVFVENLKQAIDFDSCVKAALKDSSKLSNCTFSAAYEAVMPSGMLLAVKKLKSVDHAVVHHQSKMIRELERLAHLGHPNLARPIGYVIYDDVALLLHHRMPNGTLLQLLHGEAGQKPNWPRLLSVAIGVAEGLSFLHQIAIIHLDISSGNVLLDSHYNALLGEVEISKLLDPSKGTASISAVAGSFGYIPPEYAYTMQVTVPGNVYSFGVVLLEILTSRLPVDECFGEGLDLVKWVHGAPARGETPEQIMDPRLSAVSFAWRKQMLSVLKIAVLCTDHTPAKRPRMKKVVEMLIEARDS